VSVLLVPGAVLCFAFEIFGGQVVYYAIPACAGGFLPWLLTTDFCDAYDRSAYSWLALRTQAWLQLGGGVPSAVRALRGQA
jgi:hypothetical protein